MVATGSSYAKFDIDFAMDKDKFNFGVAPQSLRYDYKILQQYQDHIEESGVILIVLCPLGFGKIDFADDVYNYKYYKFLKPKYIENFKWRTYFTHILFPLLATPRLIRYIWKDVKLKEPMKLGEIKEDCSKREAYRR